MRAWVGTALGLAVVAFVWIVVVPPLANHEGLALPGSGTDALPGHVVYAGRVFTNPALCDGQSYCMTSPELRSRAQLVCESSTRLAALGDWPLQQVTRIRGLFRGSVPVYADVSRPHFPTSLLVRVGECYVSYT